MKKLRVRITIVPIFFIVLVFILIAEAIISLIEAFENSSYIESVSFKIPKLLHACVLQFKLGRFLDKEELEDVI